MGGRASRRKGFGFEREEVNRAREMGLESDRAYGSNGRALGQHEECDIVVEGIPFQCKRKKSLAAYLKPSEHVFGQVFREDRGESYVLLRTEDMWKIIRHLKHNNLIHLLEEKEPQEPEGPF